MNYTKLTDLLDHVGGEDMTPYRFGRALYKAIDCGPWVSFVVKEGETQRDIYYESEEANSRDWADACIGIKIGSIVEGSDVEIGPDLLLFPFSEAVIEDAIVEVNAEASFYWKRDNTMYIKLTNKGTKEEIFAQWTQFEDGPEGSFEAEQEALVRAAFAHLLDDDTGFPEIPGYFDWIATEEEVPDIRRLGGNVI